jgi:adenine-specific DNA-methyltransferase
VSIDDSEAHYLKVIMDEIFGRSNFIANVVWQKKFSPQNDAKWLSDNHDHVIVFAKNKSIWSPNPLPRTAEMDNRYKNPDNDPRGSWTSSDLTRAEHRDRDYYGIETPSGKILFPAKGRSWSRPKAELERLKADNRLWFGPKGTNMPRLKRFLSEVQEGLTPSTLWLYKEAGHNQEAKREVVKLDLATIFDTPKPEKLIFNVFHIATETSDIVLDSFLGSGTTAAVAHKMNRQYIGIEMGDHAETHCVPRLQKVIEGEQGGISESVNWKGGGGFRFYRLGEPVFNDDGRINPSIKFPTLAAHIWFCETRTPYTGTADTPLLGVQDGVAYYLLFNGILGDKTVDGGNVLTTPVLKSLTGHDGPKVIYGEGCRFGAARLKKEQITFKHIPYDIKAR